MLCIKHFLIGNPISEAMAQLEHVSYIRHSCEVIKDHVAYEPIRASLVTRLPQVFWADQTPWQEANLWAHERAMNRDVDSQTIESNMRGMIHYANFLESEGLKWFEFPIVKADRCLVQYRGYLKEAIKSGDLAASTASARMRSVIAFYRWAQQNRLLSHGYPLWNDSEVNVRVFNKTGFDRTIQRVTTDLSIPNRPRPGERLEGGLLPVSTSVRDAILEFAKREATPELFLMLSLGFFTGMRLGTICDLKIRSLEHAVPDPVVEGMFHVAIGPGASPSVHTKFGVTGSVWIPYELLKALKEYAYSSRRLTREAR